MPGSKTFTSSTNLEFLEASLIERYKKLKKTSSIDHAVNGVIEVAKICLSAIICALYSLQKDIAGQFAILSSGELYKWLVSWAIIACGLFFFGYLLFSVIAYIISFFLDAVFNSRRRKCVQERAKSSFREITVNLMMLAVSFEHKCYAYHKQEARQEDIEEKNAWLDLEIQYFLKAISYFDCAAERLEDAVPPQMKSFSKERVNIAYMDAIGFDSILANISIAIQSMKRLQKISNGITGKNEEYSNLSNRISAASYTLFLDDQGSYLDEIIDIYEKKLNLTANRKKQAKLTN